MCIELIPHLFDVSTSVANPNAGGRPTGQRGLYAHWRNTSKVTNPDAFRVLTAIA
jgi:predicted phage gp36 major capsid-like protein